MNRARANLVAVLAAVLAMAIAVVVLAGGEPEPIATTAATAAPETTVVLEPTTFSELPTVALDELPVEAIETLDLIALGGPYPYRQDDQVFQNREGLLPDRPDDHYREYTVDTPGASDRGARRIVTGRDGERYWTEDHYDSFREIVG